MFWKALILAALLLPGIVLAHDGHGTADVLVEVISAEASDHTLRVEALLSNRDSAPVVLTGLWSEGATLEGSSLPVLLPGDEARIVTAELAFDDAVPGILTLNFVFGDEGSGPVLIVPEIKEAGDV